MSELLIEQSSAYQGAYPSIPNRAGFAPDESDTAPFYVTLPLGKIGNVSGNGRLYDRDFYSELVQQVNNAPSDNPVTGIVGHSDPNGVSWKVDMPAMEWVGATLEESSGIVWGKAYIYPEETKLRSAVKRAIKNNGKVATSIWGVAKMEGNRAVSPTIKRIDYADPERAGVKAAVAVPVVTSEMTEEKDKDMSDEKLIQELRADRDTARQETSGLKEQMALLQPAHDAMKAKLESLQEMAGNKDVMAFVSELVQEVKATRAEKLKLEVNALIAEQVKLESARPLIATMLYGVQSKDEAVSRLAELLNTEAIKNTLQTLALAASGGHLAIGEQRHTGDKLDESPEALARAKELYGLN
jgi:hypothetical protein